MTACSFSVDTLVLNACHMRVLDIPGASPFQSISSDKFPTDAKSIMSVFLGMSVGDDCSLPEANAYYYEFQSGGRDH